jgi:class 3 adenylate cyclase
MGLTQLQAQRLDVRALQLALLDTSGGEPSFSLADMNIWSRTGNSTTVIPLPRSASKRAHVVQRPRGSIPRVLRAIIFGDVHGFSKLRESQHAAFVDEILGRFAAVFARHAAATEHKNTWGDGIYAVLTDVGAAARCALDLQAELARFDPVPAGLPSGMGLRLGVHYGPVFPVRDPVREALGFMGAHVSRTARM